MNRFRVSVVGSVLFIVVALACVLMSSRQSSAQRPLKPDGLTIVSPLPVPVSGTVTVGNLGATTLPVSVTNFPATQPVSGTVNIGTLPTLQTTVLNAPGSNPFSESLTSTSPQFAVPTSISGQTVKSVVVTEVSGFCTGIGSFLLGLQDIAGGSPITTFSFPVGAFQLGIFPILPQQTQIFIAAGHSLGITDTTPPHGCRLDLSGYYVTQ